MAEDFIEFIEVIIGQKTVVSGHSSGGLIAAWMAAYAPEHILGLVIEDSPFFQLNQVGERKLMPGYMVFSYMKILKSK